MDFFCVVKCFLIVGVFFGMNEKLLIYRKLVKSDWWKWLKINKGNGSCKKISLYYFFEWFVYVLFFGWVFIMVIDFIYLI